MFLTKRTVFSGVKGYKKPIFEDKTQNLGKDEIRTYSKFSIIFPKYLDIRVDVNSPFWDLHQNEKN